MERAHRQDRKRTGCRAWGGQTLIFWAHTHISGKVHKSLQHIFSTDVHTRTQDSCCFQQESVKASGSFPNSPANFSLQREAPIKVPVNISVQAECVHMRASKYNETLECRCNTRKWNIDFHLLFQTLGTLLKQKSKLK